MNERRGNATILASRIFLPVQYMRLSLYAAALAIQKCARTRLPVFWDFQVPSQPLSGLALTESLPRFDLR